MKGSGERYLCSSPSLVEYIRKKRQSSLRFPSSGLVLVTSRELQAIILGNVRVTTDILVAEFKADIYIRL